MFTGLIREIGRLRGMAPSAEVVRLDIEAPRTAAAAGLGDSIAVNGICLTVTALKGRVFSVEAASETRRLTTFAKWRRGDRLHLEPALRAGDPLDGHLVQGHVDGIGTVSRVKAAGRGRLVTFSLPATMARFLTPKGSVAVDGVSLTVDEGPFHRGEFTVNLIPHTLDWTNFGRLRAGQQVNLEMDVLVKAARGASSWDEIPSLENNKAKEAKPAGLTLERLLTNGFNKSRSKGRS